MHIHQCIFFFAYQLSRLSDTGEEYIVLTASTDDKTCGHIGSEKGEGFIQSSKLQSVKKEFLDFCTGKYW